MKYPKNQFKNLLICLEILSKYIDITSITPFELHYQIAINFIDSHSHNWLMINDNKIYRNSTAPQGSERLFPFMKFEMYPNNCNDENIKTAVSKAINQTLK